MAKKAKILKSMAGAARKRPSRPPSDVPPAFHVMAKPTGSACNLHCDYCFFLKKEALYPGSSFRMPDEVHEAYIRQLLEAHQVPQVTIAWQGGEPTLMGLDFFRRSVELQKKYRKPGTRIENTFQTNGILLDDEWCRFFHDNGFLIGLSLDGPKELHDVHRKDKGGHGTFDRVLAAARRLQAHQVEFNILCTVNSDNSRRPLDVYRFFRDELGARYIQFIPIVERDNDTGYQEGSKVTDRSVGPERIRPLPDRDLRRVGEQGCRRDLRPQLRRRPGRLARHGRDGLHLRAHLRPGPGPRAQRRPLFLRSLRRAEASPREHPGDAPDRSRGLGEAAQVRARQEGHPAPILPGVRIPARSATANVPRTASSRRPAGSRASIISAPGTRPSSRTPTRPCGSWPTCCGRTGRPPRSWPSSAKARIPAASRASCSRSSWS